MSVYVKIPNPVTIYERHINPQTLEAEKRKARAMSFFDLVDWITNDAYFAKSAKLGKVAAELVAEFEDKPVGSFVKLTSEQHDHVKKVLEAPSPASMIPSIINKQIVPLIDALAEPLSEEQYRKATANGVHEAQPAASA